MGNLEFKFIENNQFLPQKMCFFNRQTKKIEITQEFFDFLVQNSQKKIKIISAIGESGSGKSTFLNFLLRSYLKLQITNGEAPKIFTYPEYYRQTPGVEYFIAISSQETLTIILNCETDIASHWEAGHYNSNINSQKSLLMQLINKISTTIFILSYGERRLTRELNIINNSICNNNVDNTNRFKDFIIVNNKWHNDLDKGQFLSDFYKQFGEIIFFPYLCHREQMGYMIKFSYLVTVENLFNELVQKYVLDKDYKNYNNLFSEYKGLYTCGVLHVYLKLVFDLLNLGFEFYNPKNQLNIEFLTKAKLKLEQDLDKHFVEKEEKLKKELRNKDKFLSLFSIDILYQLNYILLIDDLKIQYEIQLSEIKKKIDESINDLDGRKNYLKENIKSLIEIPKKYDLDFQIRHFKNQKNFNQIQIGQPKKMQNDLEAISLNFIKTLQKNTSLQNKNLLENLKKLKQFLRNRIFDTLLEQCLLTFFDLEKIFKNVLPSLYLKLPVENLARKCVIFQIIFSLTMKIVTEKHCQTFTNKQSQRIFNEAINLYNVVKELNPNFNIDFKYVFRKKQKLNTSDLIMDLDQLQKHQILLNQVESDFFKKKQEVVNLYKKLVTLRNINSYFLIKLLVRIYFADFLDYKNVISYFSNEDNFQILLVDISQL